METWCVIACGLVPEDARDEFTSRLTALLSEPRYGTGHSELLIGPWPSVAGLHERGEGRVPEPAR